MEIEDKTDEKFSLLTDFVKRIVSTTKRFIEEDGLSSEVGESSFPPAGFVCRIVMEEGELPMVAAVCLPSPGFRTEEDKDNMSSMLRSVGGGSDADAVVFISEAIYWKIDHKKIEAEGMTHESFQEQWPAFDIETRKKWAEQKECIQATMDSKYGKVMVTQHFTRDGNKPIWGEVEVIDDKGKDIEISGRFGSILVRGVSPTAS